MGLFDSIGSNLSGMISSAASTISAAASNISNAVSSTFGGGNSPSSGNNQQSGSPKSGSPTPSPAPTPSSDKSSSSSGGSSSSGAPYAPAAVDYSSLTVTPKSSSGGSITQSSPPSSGNSTTQKSDKPSNNPVTKSSDVTLTVQPIYIAGGNKGPISTYSITYSDGRQNEIAVGGQSLAETSAYYQVMANKAAAEGDQKEYDRFSKAAVEFAAAAAYEESGLNGYGQGSGFTYEAHLQENPNKPGQAIVSGATAYVSGNSSYSAPAEPLGARSITVSSDSMQKTLSNSSYATSRYATSPVTQQESQAPAVTTTLTGSGNNTSLSEPLRYQWDDSKGIFENLIEGTAYNFNKTFAEPFQVGGIGGVISNAPVAAGAAWAEAGQTVDNYVLWSDQALASDDPLQKTLGVVNTILSPVDAIRVGKMITDGRAGEITGENGAWALLDVATLVPVVGLVGKAAALGKLGKLSKLPKAADGLTDAAKAGDAVEDAAKIGKKSDKISTALQPADAAKLEKDIAKLEKTTKVTNAVGTAGTFGQMGLLGVTAASEFINELLTEDGDDGNKDGTFDQNEKPQKIWEDNPYHWEYNPGEQRSYSEQDISDILSAALAGLSGSQTAGGAGGGGEITIVNETPAASSSSSDWFEQVKPYIVPALIAIVIIALIALSGKDGKQTRSKGARV